MRWSIVVLLAVFSLNIFAGVEERSFDDPVAEQRYKHLIAELRCLVCQNQNLADSNAELAQDLRQQVYEMIKSGKDDEAIIGFMVARYGDFVLYRPPVKSTTILLWVGPFILLVIAAAALIIMIKRRAQIAPVGLTEEQRQQARQLLEEKD